MAPKRPVTVPRGWAFADPARRVFVALNRAGDAYHLIHPIEPGDRRIEDLGLPVGALTCECEGGRYRGTCYQVKQAEQLLAVFQAGGGPAPADGMDWIGGAAEEPEQGYRAIGAEQLNGFGGTR
jgi:hypothetical protein